MAQLNNFYHPNLTEAGVDEAGRGCIAGPVVAAAVILPEGFDHPFLNDSKQLSARQREIAAKEIKENAIVWAIGVVDHDVIDKINILNASFRAMNIAINALNPAPQLLLIDGNRFKPETFIPFQCIVKGDATYASIAAASILAKTHRDALMMDFNIKYPGYGWNQNKGYPTKSHREAIINHGVSPIHRLSFTLYQKEEQLHLNFGD